MKSHSQPASLPLLKGTFHLNIFNNVATTMDMIKNPAAILDANPARRASPPTNSVVPKIKAQNIPGLNPELARNPAVAFRFFSFGNPWTTNSMPKTARKAKDAISGLKMGILFTKGEFYLKLRVLTFLSHFPAQKI